MRRLVAEDVADFVGFVNEDDFRAVGGGGGFLVLGGLLLGGLTGGHHDYGGWGGPDIDLDFDFFD